MRPPLLVLIKQLRMELLGNQAGLCHVDLDHGIEQRMINALADKATGGAFGGHGHGDSVGDLRRRGRWRHDLELLAGDEAMGDSDLHQARRRWDAREGHAALHTRGHGDGQCLRR